MTAQQEMLDRQRERPQRRASRKRVTGPRSGPTRDRERNDALVDELLKDGLIKDRNHYQIKLTSRSLVIDGKEQPQKVFEKYLKLYESTTGHKLTGNNAR